MKRSIIILISIICIMIILIDNNHIDKKIKCGFNLEKNSIIVEGQNKCFKYKRPSKKEKVVKRLMIVAHPDDETIFGGSHLLEEKYTVVCITCGSVDYRVKEFSEVMKRTNDDYIMLGFVDRVNKTGPISNWDNEYISIYNTLKRIIDSDNWDVVVTHNPNGEYGHIHHKKTSEIVTSIVAKEKLYYFGHWNKNGTNDQKLDANLYNEKMNKLISVYYESQRSAINYNYNMLSSENWINANEW